MVKSVSIEYIEGASDYHVTVVTLICNGGSGNVIFFSREEENGIARRVSIQGGGGDGGAQLTINITTESEGIYSCVMGGENSTNEVSLVGKVLHIHII